MSLAIKHASCARTLWSAFVSRCLAEIADSSRTAHPSQLWLTHRTQRDHLLEAAASRGGKGWLNPPIQFLSNLPVLFEVAGTPIGLLARRHLIARLAAEHAQLHGMPGSSGASTITRGHMLDGWFGELLAEDVSPAVFEQLSSVTAADDFARRRNAWLLAVYGDYLVALERSNTYDPRQIHALVARRIHEGALPRAVSNADRLHIFGLHSTRSRQRLLQALARQSAVDVTVYTTGDLSEWRHLSQPIDSIDCALPEAVVQPAPDAHTELAWVAGQIKQLLLSGDAEPHEIAVAARTGIEDTRRALSALESAGIPATARVRTPLAEIGALKAVLDLFRAAAESWSYRSLRTLLASPYFGFRVDLRPFDRIAGETRPSSLLDWRDELQRLLDAVKAGEDSGAKRSGIFADRLERDARRFDLACATLVRLNGAKTLGEWLALARDVLSKNWFRIRQHICRAPSGRQDIVRLDQRGMHQLEAFLAEWSAIGLPDELLTPRAWHRMLRALLEQQEIVLTTPGQKGVQILEAHDAASAHFKATFLIHANDGVFPRRSALAGLFTEEERTQLRAAGLPIADRESVQLRERALWNAVAGSGERLFVSYRTTDPRGTPLLPSLLVRAHSRETELPRSAEVLGAPLNSEQVRRLQAGELRQRMLAGVAPGEFGSIEPAALRHALLVAYAEQLRGAPDRLQVTNPRTPWNGQLTDPWVLQRLDERFGPDYPWSPSQLQLYAECPFFFLLDRVLRLEALEEADEETSVLTVGGVAHDVLQVFYDEVKTALPATLNDHAAARLQHAADDVFAAREASREWLGSPVIWKQKKRRIRDILHDYVAWELEHLADKGEWPTHCEYVLGGGAGFVLLAGNDLQGRPVEMRVAGRIDRIDSNALGRSHVLDYKTSSIPSVAGYDDGVTLQTPVYLEALRESGFTAGKGRYRALKRPGKPQNGAEVKADDSKYNRALAVAFSIPARVRAGLFEVQLAASQKDWKTWQPGLDSRRTAARLESGTRFDG